MKAVVQRVDGVKLSVDGNLVSEIGKGLAVYFGVERGDSEDQLEYYAKKISQMRVFEDERGKMNFSALDNGYEVMLIPQFTLCADCSRGNRPDFTRAESPDIAKALYLKLGSLLESRGLTVKYGVFGADMFIEQINSGPVTIII